jgi:DNA-binding NarL/FixJ family response regulator
VRRRPRRKVTRCRLVIGWGQSRAASQETPVDPRSASGLVREGPRLSLGSSAGTKKLGFVRKAWLLAHFLLRRPPRNQTAPLEAAAEAPLGGHELGEWAGLGPLTRRELQIVLPVGIGYSNPFIASELVVSLNTIKKQTSTVYA